jgi:predicted PurR-regulated permease PerM
MWPRLLSQLFELLPHVTRLVPLAEGYFALRSASERAQEAALAALAETMRSDLAGLTQSQTGLAAQLQARIEAQAGQLARLSEDLDRNRRELAAQTTQLETVTRQLKRLGVWVIASAILVLLLFLGALVFLLLLHDGMAHST